MVITRVHSSQCDECTGMYVDHFQAPSRSRVKVPTSELSSRTCLRVSTKVHPALAHRAGRLGTRVAGMQHASREHGMACRVRVEQRVTTPCTIGGRRCMMESQCSRVCMCREGWACQPFAPAYRFSSHTSHTAHRSRSQSTASARNREK